MRNVGIVGRKRSGKDTAAQALVEELGYARHGLADPLKDAALKLDPIVTVIPQFYSNGDSEPVRLSEVVAADGWENAKDEYPEVRRILQKLGDEAGRQVHGPDTWIDQLLRKTWASNDAGRPVVVPDVRYPNEAERLRAAGFLIVRIDRPGFSDPQPGEHASEQVERLFFHHIVRNEGSVEDLTGAVLGLANPAPMAV